MIKDILDFDGNVIGQLELPDDTRDEVWDEKLAIYAKEPPKEKSLDEVRDEMFDKLRESTRAYILSHYDIEEQSSLQLLRGDARADGMQNRFNYIQKIVDWCNTVIGYHYQLKGQMYAARDLDELLSVQQDYSQFTPEDPLVTIYGAMQILD
jgi:hypothetical protein